jgi:hypothetical protein
MMKVDRTRFLLLTGMLSSAALSVVATGTGCSSKTEAKDAGPATQTTPEDSGSADGGTVDSGGHTSDAAPACLDDTTAPAGADAGDCAATSCAATCAKFSSSFKAGVAHAIGQCLLLLPTCEGDPTSCVDEVLGKACQDPQATTICTPLVTACAPTGDAGAPALTQAGCEALINGLNDTGQESFISCITEGTAGHCTSDPGYCVSNIKLQ